MKFINEEDLTDENFAKGWQQIEELCDRTLQNIKRLNESQTPKFNSIEEANKYYNAIPFEEWENKMFEKYGL